METITGDPASAKMTGPRNPVLESQFPNVINAPATDISTQPFFWSSFNISPGASSPGLGARGHPARFRDFRRDRRGEHVPRAGCHP
jgi:oxalate decarboxylase